MDLRSEVTVTPGLPVVAFSGIVDLSTLATLRDVLLRIVTEHPRRRVAVDLDGVEMIDDAGLGIVLGGAARARGAGGDLVVVVANPRIRRRFSVSRFDRAIELHGTLAEAASPPVAEAVFHVALPADVAAAEPTGSYTTSTRGVTLDDEGYIHCSFAHQVDTILARRYGDVDEVVVLRLDPTDLGGTIVVEDLLGTGEPFPHVYGPIPLTAVVGREVRRRLR